MVTIVLAWLSGWLVGFGGGIVLKLHADKKEGLYRQVRDSDGNVIGVVDIYGKGEDR